MIDAALARDRRTLCASCRSDEDDGGRQARATAGQMPVARKAFASEQTNFDGVAEPTDDGLPFLTRVRGAPLLIWGVSNETADG